MAPLPSGMVLAIPLALLLGGCVTFTPDGGMAPVASRVSGDIGGQVVKITSEEEAATARARVSALLSRPLDARAALQVALLNNRGLQAQYNALGISEAAYVAASLPPNPSFGVERLNGGGELDVERRLVANVLALLTLPARSEIAGVQFEAARHRAIEATFRTAAEARRAYYRAVAARQAEAFLEKARLTADAAADLTVKLGETGAATKLDQARASAFYAEVSNELARARLKSATDREALTRQLGLWGNDVGYRLPSQLPRLPGRIRTEPQVEVEAVLKRTDLIAARLELDAMAKSLGLTQATRFVSLLEGGYRGNYQRADGETLRPQGFELEVQVPIFDLGETNVRRAQETYMQAANLLMEKAVNVRSEARAAYVTYRASYDIARQYQARILPLRKTINEQALLEYNGMLIDVFELLTTERESIDSNVSAIGAQRDFFLAEVDFQTAIIGGGAGGGETVLASAAAGASD
ncbi:TolC family protein [Xanthobacter sp. DSM 24535]|uniref:Outer membrane protein TolC n=1 Tax=Aquabacter spiritensis TaxID=933073 RepID=A0A4R3LQL0_9HYPH|nr:TolC family protein [Aquabacter spiritensis]OYY13343.1 MAG: copper resistance protein [Rhizobiales bacterium 35-68-8]TCT01889.1 outer membrane protein TolC [Aquabacter spiritensis]